MTAMHVWRPGANEI